MIPRIPAGAPAVCLLALLTACGFDRPLAPEVALPVVQGVLVAGADSQFVTLDWAISADSIWTPGARPIAAGSVALTITSSTGSQPLTLRPGGFGTFIVTLPIVADSTYQLTGTIAGEPVEGEVRLPASLTVIEPAGDTIIASLNCPFASCAFPYQLETSGAAAVIMEARTVSGVLLYRQRLEGGSGEATILSDPAIATLDFLAVDPNASAYLAQEPKSSVAGGFGVFGGSLRVRKQVVWE